MNNEGYITLDKFTMPICKICNQPATIVIRDNGAGGEYCDPYEEYAAIICKTCNTEEELR